VCPTLDFAPHLQGSNVNEILFSQLGAWKNHYFDYSISDAFIKIGEIVNLNSLLKNFS
jgi:hypothetical protein